MHKKKKFSLFPDYSDRLIFIGSIGLALYGTIMIISAEMGETTGNLSAISSTLLKQGIFLIIGIIGLIIFTKVRFIKLQMHYIWIGYFIVFGLLIVTRAFPAVGGAYGWIRFGGFTIQPSEFAKLYVILLAAKLFEINDPKTNKSNFIIYCICALAYVGIVFVIENDLGSAVVIGGIAYVCALIPPYKELRKYQNWMIILILAGVIGAVILLSSFGTKLLSNFGNSYKIKRFLASADPFAYQYDSGYHLVMSLVSFATGGLFGLGYGKSIHKFMNFPNPSTDFILPVIIEEMGVVFGLVPILILYGFIIFPLAFHCFKCDYARGKIVMIGAFMYFILHFILNVGGVSGLIPLTGVPLLLVSSGRTALISCLATLGLAEGEIINYRKRKYLNRNENNSG